MSSRSSGDRGQVEIGDVIASARARLSRSSGGTDLAGSDGFMSAHHLDDVEDGHVDGQQHAGQEELHEDDDDRLDQPDEGVDARLDALVEDLGRLL